MGLKGYEKAALFLIALGEDVASEVLKSLDPVTVKTLTLQMKRFRRVTKKDLEEVIKEAAGIIERDEIPVSGPDFIKNLLPRGLGEERAREVMEIISEESPFELFEGTDPKALAAVLRNEHPQIIAMALSLMEPEKAAKVLNLFPDKLKGEVASRIAVMERIPEEGIEELREILKGRIRISTVTSPLRAGRIRELKGTKALADILNYCDKVTEEIVFQKIEEQDIDLADEIRENMFTFEDFITLDDRSIQLILKEVSTDDLAIALKTATEALKEKIFKNMSQRAVQILKDEMEAKGPVRVSDIQKAQKNIASVARRLEKEGRIIISKGGEGVVV